MAAGAKVWTGRPEGTYGEVLPEKRFGRGRPTGTGARPTRVPQVDRSQAERLVAALLDEAAYRVSFAAQVAKLAEPEREILAGVVRSAREAREAKRADEEGEDVFLPPDLAAGEPGAAQMRRPWE